MDEITRPVRSEELPAGEGVRAKGPAEGLDRHLGAEAGELELALAERDAAPSPEAAERSRRSPPAKRQRKKGKAPSAETQPTETQPTETQSAETQPTETQSAETESAATAATAADKADDADRADKPAKKGKSKGKAKAKAKSAEAPASDAAADEDDAPKLSDPDELARVLLAVLLVSREAVSKVRLAQVCNSTQKAVTAGLERLREQLENSGMPIRLSPIGDSARLLTVPEVFPYLKRLRGAKKADRLSPAALETLAVVAYRQPVMRNEIEAIRGVKVGPTLHTLLDHKLIDVVGRADVPGRPLQYGTTQHFLDRFGLASLDDLPSVKEFRSLG